MAILGLNFRIHELFKAKLGLLGEEEDDGYLTAFLLKAGAFLHPCVFNQFNVVVRFFFFFIYSQSYLCRFPQMMEDTQSDFTMSFRQLSEVSAQQLYNKNYTQVELTEDH